MFLVIFEEGLCLCKWVIHSAPHRIQNDSHEWHQWYINYIIKIMPGATLARENFKLRGYAHLEINFSCMTFHLKLHQPTILSEFLEVSMPWFPKKTTISTTETSIFIQRASSALHASPPRPSLLFTAFCTCILFHALINPSLPCPHFSSNKRSCIKSMNSELRSRAQPGEPFWRTRHGLAECNLKSYNTF